MYADYKAQGTELLAVAIDFQGASKARPYVEQARAAYPNVIDTENTLSLIFGFKVVPNGILVDEAGIIRYTKFGGFDIRKPEYRQLVEGFVRSPNPAELEKQAEQAGGFKSSETLNHFRQGLSLYRQGQTEAALAEWRRGVVLEPDNWLIRKQVWAIENPERFYQGEVDFEWQKLQITENR
jgi:hypothetical protein